MTSNGIFDNTIATLERSLNLRSLQHRVLSANIANMDTPNYKAVELVVEEEIHRGRRASREIQLVRTHDKHFPIKKTSVDDIHIRTADPPKFSLRGDGNTVDVDRTMGQLAENTILYKTSAQLISAKLNALKNAIKGGR